MKCYYALPMESFHPPAEGNYRPFKISKAQLKIHNDLVNLLVTERGVRFQIGDFPDK